MAVSGGWYVRTNELVPGTAFSFDNQTFELPILYRSAISNIPAITAATSIRRRAQMGEAHHRFFRDRRGQGRCALFNLVPGWAGDFTEAYGRTSVDARIKANPGGVFANNSSADWAAFTGGRVTDATYVRHRHHPYHKTAA